MIDTELLKRLYPTKEKQLAKLLQQLPVTTSPIVTQSDVAQGFIQRYFVRAANDQTFVVEIDKKQFELLKHNPRFITATIKWKIIGKQQNEYRKDNVTVYGTTDTNRQTVANADLTFGGLRKYIQDYAEYWVAEKV